VDQFVAELKEGLKSSSSNIPMLPTWVMDFPTGEETGDYLAIDLGGTNIRVILVRLLGNRKFDTIQSKYVLPKWIRTSTSNELWLFIAQCVKTFIDEEFDYRESPEDPIPLGFTFSYPAFQSRINSGVLQRWTKGFDIPDVEGHDVVPMLQDALESLGLSVVVVALINDTTGTLVASTYTDPETKMGLIFGTGVNGAYYDTISSVSKISNALPPDIQEDASMAINCEYGAFDNNISVLPRTKYDDTIDLESPRPGQQSYEKMISGYYLGELLRLVLVDLHHQGHIFKGQTIGKLNEPFIMDTSFPARIEEDPFENLCETGELFNSLGIETTVPERELIRRICELIGTRAARLSVCSIAAICKKRGYKKAHCAADGSVFTRYPYFPDRAARALRDIFQWGHSTPDLVTVVPAEDGSGVGAAIIAALTKQRMANGESVGLDEYHPQDGKDSN